MPDTETRTAQKIAAIRTIRKLMEFWSISARELRTGAPKNADRPATAQKLPVRYRHPVSGEEWDGIGRQPDWLRHALIKEGYTVEEIRVEPID